ncbi:hypothetical protein [Streptomyces sp. KN37]|uniref:hypothetical protein n=1 Tax=Streptomyces sp. KN37 TaxID=3090667 RepID=UPI002A7647A2|nr:hypothetical protein [Streptomyces sp. KN37]WPO70220.1 hypothetical protein R9806_06045 [Streptomyces sp. KN37]WPO74009.1 hypothetical protein R9806_27015 [Streptomyces sp. KN37]
MLRIIAWALLALYLLVVGLWPAALAPITLAFTGAGVVLAAIPGPVLLAVAAIAWLKHRPAPAKPVTA